MPPPRKPLLQRVASVLDLQRRNPHLLWMALALRTRRRLHCTGLGRMRIGGIRFRFDQAPSHYMQSMRLGEYEIETVAAMRHFLRQGSTFIDVGANLGYFSAWALHLTGARGRVIAFEPVPELADRLEVLCADNPGCGLAIHRVALGEAPGTAEMTLAGDAMLGGNTMVAGLVPPGEARGHVNVTIARLDAHVDAQRVGRAALMKIDVEGFEDHVLRGMRQSFQNGFGAPIICEVTPSALRLQGRDLNDLLDYMRQWGYLACSLRDFRPLNPERIRKLGKMFNVIFIRS